MSHLRSSLVVALLSAASHISFAAPAKPNIVFILADDIGLGDISHHAGLLGKKDNIVPTPNIDALARSGIWFTDGHSSTALCSPTRYCAMTGNHNYRSYAPWGVWGSFRESPVKPGEATLGTVARDAGYSTAFIGKWHLGGDFRIKGSQKIYRGDDRGDPNFKMDVSEWVGGGPQSLGFDYDYTLPTGVQGPIYTAYENGKWAPFEKDSKIIYLDEHSASDPAFVSDKGPGPGDSNWDTRKIGRILSDKAASFIARQSADKPFFLYYCTPTVHLPHCPPEEFNGVKIAGQTPTRHLDMILDLDQQVRTIVDALGKSGAYQNTLILFSSDNGGLADGPAEKAGHNSNGGFRGHKNTPTEGGHRVPFLATWPGRIKPGTTSEVPVATHDILATIAAVAGTTVPAGQAMDSANLLPILTGSSTSLHRPALILQGGSRNEIVYRKGEWKLIIQSDHKVSKFEPTALFNLSDNVTENESENMVRNPEQKARVQSMLAEYLDIRKSLRPTAN